MIKRISALVIMVIMIFAVFGLTGCESINRATVDHESLAGLQTVLPELYYFNFEAALETNDSEVGMLFESMIKPLKFNSKAIITQNITGKYYEHFGYSIFYNLKTSAEEVALSITGYKHNSRDFIVTDARISSEYQDAINKADFIAERTIDGIRCVIYGSTTVFFWIGAQQYMITIHHAIDQEFFTIRNFTSFIEFAISNRYKI